jgi:hypothetical protein
MIRNAKDLSPDQKTVLESLLGRRILADEAISVRAIEPPALSEHRRLEQFEQLRKYFAEVDSRASRAQQRKATKSSPRPSEAHVPAIALTSEDRPRYDRPATALGVSGAECLNLAEDRLELTPTS